MSFSYLNSFCSIKGIRLTLVAFLFFSCGSIKKYKENVKAESTTTENNVVDTQIDEKGINYTFTPFDASKPIIFRSNGKTDTIYNTIVEKHFYNKNTIVKDTTSKKIDTKIDVQTKDKKTDNSVVIIGVVGLLFLFLLLVIILLLKK